MSGAPLALAVLISGRGSNMAAIARACAAGEIQARIARVIADRADAAGLALARKLGLEASVVPSGGRADRGAFEAALRSTIDASGARLLVLAGFMRVLSPEFTAHYAGAMLNIHPSLLPKYPGLHTHARVLAAGDLEHGATVHFVTDELDAGPIVLQARVPVRAGDSIASLSARVQEQEHIIYPRVIGWIAAGRLRWAGSALLLDGRPLQAAPHEEA
jgi:phosphoribosylglycinamide formyltransferase-1